MSENCKQTARPFLVTLILSFCALLPASPEAVIFGQAVGADRVGADSSEHYYNLGTLRLRSGDFEQAVSHFLRSLSIKKREGEPISADMAGIYNNLGVANRRLYNTGDAMLCYDTARTIYVNLYGPDYRWLGVVYQNQGNILRDKRDFGSAFSYFNNAFRIFTLNGMTEWLAMLHNNMGIAYYMTGDYERAKENYRLSLGIRERTDPASVSFPAGNLAICYKETGDISTADTYYRMALDAVSENLGEQNPNYAINLMNYGLFLITDGEDPERGYEMLLRALEVHRSVFGEKGQHIARTLMNIGYYHETTGEYEKALEYQQRSLVANSKSFTPGSIEDNPAVDDDVFSPDYIIASLKHKAIAFLLLAGETNRLENLGNSLLTYRAAIGFIERMRMGHLTEESRILLAENEHETYMQALHAAWKLFELTSGMQYLEEAFELSERSKAAGLLASLRDVEARSFGGVPEDLLEQERSLKRRIAAFSELIYEEQRIANASAEKITFWQERVFSLELELNELVSMLEENFPDYYALKYDTEVAGIERLKKSLGSKDALVSYVYNDSIVYIFTVTGRDAGLLCKNIGEPLDSLVATLLDVVTTGNLDRNVREDFRSFTTSSGSLYNILIDPVIDRIRGKRLVIVPDGLLSYVPFELLLSSGRLEVTDSYRNLPYLLREFTISYGYSATLWRQSLKKPAGGKGKMLAMAPSYEYSELPVHNGYSNRQYYRDKLMPLPGAREEAITVAALMDGMVMLDEEATEYNFKRHAGDYRMLHLAMHTLIDDENPMFSKLIFSESGDDDEDGLLNTYEIYNLSLNASLAVLSSCRSGYGTLRHGEGVMSLARGFLYAGVPSIVMTNWEIEDKSGAEIMTGFYSYIIRGYRKDEALRLARLDFLENVDMLRAHPYFWGAYVCIGNPGEVFNTFRNFYPLVTFVFFLAVIILVLWKGHFRIFEGRRR